MSLIGNVGPYEESEKFMTYVARVKLYFTANEIEAERQVPAFLSIIGSKLFALTADLVSPKAPQDCSLDELIKALSNSIPYGTHIIDHLLLLTAIAGR